MLPVSDNHRSSLGLPEKIPEERAQKESDIEEKVISINWEEISTSIEKIADEKVWAPNSKKPLTKQELQELVIKLKEMTFTKLSDNAVHLRKQDTQLTRGIEITPEGKIYVLLKDRFAGGEYKTASLAVDLTTGGTVVHATIPFKKGRAGAVENEIAFGKELEGPRFVKMLHTTKYQAKDGTWKWGIMMELCNRGDLFDMIVEDDWNVDPEVSWRILEDCLVAMVELEKRGIHHRDIKPENFLLQQDKDGKIRVKLGDFGVSTYIEEEKKKPTNTGTPLYGAPEQWTTVYQNKKCRCHIKCFDERLQQIDKSIDDVKNNMKTADTRKIAHDRELKRLKKNRETYANLIKKYQHRTNQQSQKDVTLKTDIWSMGMVLFTMRKIEIPFVNEYDSQSEFVLSKPSVDLYFSAGTNEAVGKGEEVKTLEQLNRMMLRVNPEDRPTAGKCLETIRKLRQQKSSFN